MKIKRKILNVFILMVFTFSCKSQSNSLDIIGNWSCLLPDSTYCELYIDNKVRVLTTKNGWFGPYKYKIKDDSLCFKSRIENCKIEKKGCDEFILKNNNGVYKLKKIELKKVKEDTSFINPFHLRRCYFLVHEGVITMKEAIDYLKSLKKASVKEEKIPIK